MYYVKEKGKCIERMEVVTSMEKMEKMLELLDYKKVFKITVIKHSGAVRAD
jgi:hypothetical protein